MAISKLADQRVISPYHGGAFAAGQPTIIVTHSTETPVQTGRAYQSADYVRRVPKLSAHIFVDPGEIVAGLDEALVGWAAGNANQRALHAEFTGYAHYSRARWLNGDTESGEAMIALGARLYADWSKRHGIPLVTLTDAELRAGRKGVTTHGQCSRVFGGTDHTDPGPGFPMDLLLAQANKLLKPTEVFDMAIDKDTFRKWVRGSLVKKNTAGKPILRKNVRLAVERVIDQRLRENGLVK